MTYSRPRTPVIPCVAIFLLLAAIPVWRLFIAPEWTNIPGNFSYKADLVSLDNLYDDAKGAFSGKTRSLTKFSYEVTGQKNGVLLINNTFDVRKITGEQIFAVSRLYGIDPHTGKHVAGYGDHDRDGYLFAPRHLQKGQPFTYWHINYDGPAHMTYAGEETLFGLTVYRYQTHYNGVTIDQTQNLQLWPSVGVTRRIIVEPYLQIWVEPVSGQMVKYSDSSTAYYEDTKTGKRLNPWNTFSNTFTTDSIATQVQTARLLKMKIVVVEDIIPLLFGLCALLVILWCGRRRAIIRWSVLALLGLALCVEASLWFTQMQYKPQPTAGMFPSVRVGTQIGLETAPFWIAQKNGYFQDEGIPVEVTEFQSGKTALQTMLSGKTLDLVTAGQTPVVLSSFDYQDFSIISGMTTSTNQLKILARRDLGIQKPEDLRGKKVGTTRGSTGHYFLGLFLAQHGLSLTDIKMADIDAMELPKALADGRVDAISTADSSITQGQALIGENGILFEDRGIFRNDMYLLGTEQWIRNNPAEAAGMVRALQRAEEFLRQHKEDAVRVLADKTQLDAQHMLSTWDTYSFNLFLDQAVLLTLEQQARWIMANGLTLKKVAPNYLDFLSFDVLETVKPDAITILR